MGGRESKPKSSGLLYRRPDNSYTHSLPEKQRRGLRSSLCEAGVTLVPKSKTTPENCRPVSFTVSFVKDKQVRNNVTTNGVYSKNARVVQNCFNSSI